MTKKKKVEIISNCEEVTTAVKILISLMDESEIENFVSIDYEALGNKYRLEFSKLKQQSKD